ncbi:MAG: translation initiation factor IF-2 subunit gamma [Candidatus Diapherotrites archaeon]|nr:translation initiation factor IF-2 subunit gamma [Candidatus Diapherotrites archaeon]
MHTKSSKGRQAEINIGLVGHVDHGKSSLCKALTGKWTDTHSEELKRGITIRLGYADAVFMKCPKCKGVNAFGAKEKCSTCGSTPKMLRAVSFVDAPGHETLMTTMLSGAAVMDGAILVIAANETCPQPRTEEHLMALKIACVKNVVIAQNKADLVSKEDAEKNHEQIKKFLKEHGYDHAPVIPISATFGLNMDALIHAVEEHIPTPARNPSKALKMFVSRSFDVNKPGTQVEALVGGVLGGSILEGTFKAGEDVELSPGINNTPTVFKVINIHTASGELTQGLPGGLIAIGTDLDPFLTQNDKFRGHVLGTPGSLPKPRDRLVMEIHELDRLIGEKLPPIKPGELVVLTIGTLTIAGEAGGLKKKELEVFLKGVAVFWPGQKIAITRREKGAWRLKAYGIAKG